MVAYDHTFNVTGRTIAYFNAGRSQGVDARADVSRRLIPQVDPDDDPVTYLDFLGQEPGAHNLEVLVENGSRFWDLAKLRGFEGVLITPQYSTGIGAVLEQANGGDRWLDQPHIVRCLFHLTEDWD
jgi:hypothetical protein